MKIKFLSSVLALILLFSCKKADENQTLKFYDLEASLSRKLSLINNLSQLGSENLNKLKNESTSETEKDEIANMMGFSSYSQMVNEFNSIQQSLESHIKSDPNLMDKQYFLAKYGSLITKTLESQFFYKPTLAVSSPFKKGYSEQIAQTSTNLIGLESGCCPCTDAYNNAVGELTFNVAMLGLAVIAGGAAAIAASAGLAAGIAGGSLAYLAAYHASQLQSLENCWSSCVSSGYQSCW